MPQRPLTEDEQAEIEANLFPDIRQFVRSSPDFPWHRDRWGRPTAGRRESSQALAVDLFLTVQQSSSRDAIVNAWMTALGLPTDIAWELELERLVPRETLGESRQTQVDASIQSAKALVLLECKFTEPDGGGCSQVNPLLAGRHKGVRQCNGAYTAQVNPVNGREARCALTAKGIRYWSWAPRVMGLDADVDHDPCPLAGGTYQWLRNLASAAAMSEKEGLVPAFVVVYADGAFPMAAKVRSETWREFSDAVSTGEVPFRWVSYQWLATIATQSAAGERAVFERLQGWLQDKIRDVHGAVPTTSATT